MISLRRIIMIHLHRHVQTYHVSVACIVVKQSTPNTSTFYVCVRVNININVNSSNNKQPTNVIGHDDRNTSSLVQSLLPVDNLVVFVNSEICAEKSILLNFRWEPGWRCAANADYTAYIAQWRYNNWKMTLTPRKAVGVAPGCDVIGHRSRS